jgi:hypothetical protein
MLKMIQIGIESGSKDSVFSTPAKTIGKSINISIALLIPKMNRSVQKGEFQDRI